MEIPEVTLNQHTFQKFPRLRRCCKFLFRAKPGDGHISQFSCPRDRIGGSRSLAESWVWAEVSVQTSRLCLLLGLAEAQGHGHTRPPRPVTQEGQGRAWESQCPGREPGWLCPLTVRAPSCRLATEDVFCQRCRDGIGWGTCFFSVSSTSLEIISVA